MLEAIKELGYITDESGQDFIEALAQPLAAEKKGKKQYLVIIKINTNDLNVDFEANEIDNNTAAHYAWIGNLGGTNNEWYATTNNLANLVSMTIPNLIEKLPQGDTIRQKLKTFKDNKFFDAGEQYKNRYRFVWDLNKLEMLKEEDAMKKILKKALDSKDGVKNFPKGVANEVLKFMSQKLLLTKDEVGLWTLEIDGQLISEYLPYRHMIEREKIDELYVGIKSKGICSACGKLSTVTSDAKKLTFKYYNINKMNFSANVNGNFDKNMVLCKACYTALLKGEAFIKNHFNTSLGGFKLYIIPGFLFDTIISAKKMAQWSEYINESFNSARNAEAIKSFEDKLKDNYLEYEDEKNNYILNLMFYKKNNNELKILKFIKDISPSRLSLLARNTSKVKSIGDSLFGSFGVWTIDLNKIYHLVPLHKTKDSFEYKKLLDLYDDIFTGKPVSYGFLIETFVDLARIHRMKQYKLTHNIASQQNNDRAMIEAIQQANLFLLYLQNLNLLTRSDSMDTDKLLLSDDMKNYISMMGYDEPKTSLFLLGYLVGQIAGKQKDKGMDSKPILNKLNFQGMTQVRLWRLSNEIFEKLEQYKLLEYNEGVFAQHKMLAEKCLNDWPLSDQENVFYILSGYAYNTLAAIKGSKKQKGEENNE